MTAIVRLQAIAWAGLGCVGENPTQSMSDSAISIEDTADTPEDTAIEDTAVEDTAPEDTGEDCDLDYGIDPFADAVIAYQPGEGAGFGQDEYPAVVLGPPFGGGENAGGLDVLSLGENGRIDLALEDWIAVDGEGPDIIIFENPFTGWVEPGIVSASLDGETWVTWPCDTTDAENNYPGCAGISPVLSNPDNCIDATDPTVAGGDAYDLADIGLESAAFIRIRDAGVSGPGGFDLDAVSVINGQVP